VRFLTLAVPMFSQKNLSEVIDEAPTIVSRMLEPPAD
jgi:hypothetical protein